MNNAMWRSSGSSSCGNDAIPAPPSLPSGNGGFRTVPATRRRGMAGGTPRGVGAELRLWDTVVVCRRGRMWHGGESFALQHHHTHYCLALCWQVTLQLLHGWQHNAGRGSGVSSCYCCCCCCSSCCSSRSSCCWCCYDCCCFCFR